LKQSLRLTEPVSCRPGPDGDAFRTEPFPDAARKGKRVGAVAVQTHGFGANRYPGAVDRAHLLVANHRERLVEGDVFVVMQRAGRAALDQRAVGVVAAVGEHFFLHAQAGVARHGDHLAVGQAEEDEVGVVVAHGADDRVAQPGVAHGHVVQRAMRLHVGQLATLRAHHRVERADLVQHVGIDGLGVALHFGTAEILAVRKARMRANGHVVVQRPLHGLQHRRRIARVPAARHVGGTDQLDQGFVIAAAFAKVGIQVDLHGAFSGGVGTI